MCDLQFNWIWSVEKIIIDTSMVFEMKWGSRKNNQLIIHRVWNGFLSIPDSFSNKMKNINDIIIDFGQQTKYWDYNEIINIKQNKSNKILNFQFIYEGSHFFIFTQFII